MDWKSGSRRCKSNRFPKKLETSLEDQVFADLGIGFRVAKAAIVSDFDGGRTRYFVKCSRYLIIPNIA